LARGDNWWHAAVATFRITPVPNGTQAAVEVLVERATMRGYMLFDVGGYYNGQIDKWFSGIAQRLGGAQEQVEQVLVGKTTSSLKVRQGCLAGCLVYLIVGSCLGIIATALDRAVYPHSSGSFQGPFDIVASVIGLSAGIGALLYVMYPDAPASKIIRERLQGARHRERQ
jgi:hypothetical protein